MTRSDEYAPCAYKNGVVATKTFRGHCGDFCEDVTVFTPKEQY